MFKHSSAFEGTWLLGNWMLNLRLDGVCIWSCSKWLPCCNDLLISSLSSADLSLLMCAWIYLAVWKLRQKQWQPLKVWCEMKRCCSQSQRLSLTYWAWKTDCFWKTRHKLTSKTFPSYYHIAIFKCIILLSVIKITQFDRCRNKVMWQVVTSRHICVSFPTCDALKLHSVASVLNVIHFYHTCLRPSSSSGYFMSHDPQLNQKTLWEKSLGKQFNRLLFCATLKWKLF